MSLLNHGNFPLCVVFPKEEYTFWRGKKNKQTPQIPSKFAGCSPCTARCNTYFSVWPTSPAGKAASFRPYLDSQATAGLEELIIRLYQAAGVHLIIWHEEGWKPFFSSGK